MTTQSTSPAPRAIALWLLSCAALVFTMVVIGAITRLTESGLSMVEWRPLLGALPPMNEAEWQRVYALYQASPQFQKTNFWMEINDFKAIFFWEWAHRLLGRFIGIAYALPLLYFWLRKQIPAGYKPKFLFVLFLGGCQGLMGWYMVKSGLVDIPAVSHFRLSAHLTLAFLIFACLVWLALSVLRSPDKATQSKPLFIHGLIVLGIYILTVFWGAFTAGLDAGLVYNTHFPMMTDTSWLPPEGLDILHDHGAVQFTHRWLAIATLLLTLSWWAHSWRRGQTPLSLKLLAVMIIVQAALGITTLLSGVNIHAAVTHQAGALITLLLILVTIHQMLPRRS